MKTDYLIIGAGAMGIAFADEIFHLRPNSHITIVDRRPKAGGHWNDAYPFVRLHQPAAFYGVNSSKLGNGRADLSSKSEILNYYDKVISKFTSSGRVTFLPNHNYLGNGQVKDLQHPDRTLSFAVNKRLVDATYMNVEVPSTHAPKYKIEDGVNIVPINDLAEEYNKWDKYYVIGSGKTGMDAVLFLLEKKVPADNIYWISPNQSWMFNRSALQVGKVAKVVLRHADYATKVSCANDIFVEMEKEGSIMRINEDVSPPKWRCATVSPEELAALRKIKNIIEKGRVSSITKGVIQLEKGDVTYAGKALFVDCSANGISKRKQEPIFSKEKITLQSILFCQQVFSAAIIARLELTNISDKKKNKAQPVPHPEYIEDWPGAMSVSIQNLLEAHRRFPLWMFRSRLNFMSHEPISNYFYYALKANMVSSSLTRAAKRMEDAAP